MIKKLTTLLVTALLILSCNSINVSETTEQNGIPASKLLADIEQLEETIKNEHPKTFTNTEKLYGIIDEKKDGITNMSEYEFFRYIAPITSAIDCSHIYMDYSQNEKNSLWGKSVFFPLDIRVINDMIFVFNDPTGSKMPPGSIIRSINGKDSKEVLEILYDTLESDGSNKTKKVIDLNNGFAYNYYSRIESAEEFILIYSTPDNDEENTITLKSTNNPIFNGNWGKEENKAEFFDNYAVLTIESFNFYYDEAELKSYNEMLNNFFIEIKNKDLKKLIIDLRGNMGGPSEAGDVLLSYLLSDPYAYFAKGTIGYEELTNIREINANSYTGDLYVITNGYCMSTTGHILSHLRDQNVGVFVGEESGASYICNDASTPLILNNTGITIYMPTIAYKTPVTSLPLGRGIIPDIEIKYSIDDYLNNKDLEMEYILKNYIEL